MEAHSNPRVLHLGCGRMFVEEWLNVDADPSWQPDVVWDATSPLPIGAVPTERFGAVQMGAGCFDEIVAFEVLEHIQEVWVTMTHCLTLLRDGGRMRITVPHDLSLGAWQDPTHVRGFNENSFAYYCEWFWYLGWQTHRFHRESLELRLSESGQGLVAQGADQATLLRTPRAVDTLAVVLVKRPLSAADEAELTTWRQRQVLSAADVARA